MFVKFHPVFDQRVALDQGAQQTGLFGGQHTAQAAVGIGFVANKADTLDLGQGAFENFEYQINAVVAAADDTGGDTRRNAPGLVIGLGDFGGVIFGDIGRKHPARFALHDLLQHLVVDAAVALETDAIDGWKFRHFDHQLVALWRNFHAFEQAGAQNTLIGLVHLGGADSLATGDSRVAEHCGVFDTGVSLDRKAVKLIRLRTSGPGENRVRC